VRKTTAVRVHPRCVGMAIVLLRDCRHPAPGFGIKIQSAVVLALAQEGSRRLGIALLWGELD